MKNARHVSNPAYPGPGYTPNDPILLIAKLSRADALKTVVLGAGLQHRKENHLSKRDTVRTLMDFRIVHCFDHLLHYVTEFVLTVE